MGTSRVPYLSFLILNGKLLPQSERSTIKCDYISIYTAAAKVSRRGGRSCVMNECKPCSPREHKVLRQIQIGQTRVFISVNGELIVFSVIHFDACVLLSR